MKDRRWAALALVFVLLLTAGLASVWATEPASSLVRIAWQAGEDPAPLRAAGVEVYARLADAGGPYLLAGASPGQVAALRARGLEVRVLDADLKGASYYLATVWPGRARPDWAAHGRVLQDDGEQVLLRATPKEVEGLVQAGAELQAITLVAKPLDPQQASSAIPSDITPDPLIGTMIDRVKASTVLAYDRELAGELPVLVDGGWYTITTRYTYSGVPIQKAGRYVGQRMEALGLDVEYHVWSSETNPNVIGQYTGLVNPDEIFIIGAHLDDVQGTPGADDNASGSVATMIAADILSRYQWGCTLRFAFWTGEEQGLLGSEAYAQRAYNAGENIAGYLNLDMIAWNTIDSPPGIDLLYNSSLPATQPLAQLFADVTSAYSLNLIPELRSSSGGGSDHASFWQYGFTSILAIEDNSDFNPNYHGPGDTPAHTDLAYFTDLVKGSVGTFAHMSGCLLPSGIGHLDGHVTAAEGGAPIDGAQVTMSSPAGAPLQTTTDGSGYYTQTLLAGTYTLTAEAYAFLPALVTRVVVTTDTVTTQDLVLATAPTYTVSGTVTEAGSGQPLLAQIEFEGSPVTATTEATTGHYEATLPQGAYTMRVRAADHRPQTRAIVVEGDQRQDFTLEPLPCILLVDDDNDAPDVAGYYAAALGSLGYDYDLFEVGGASDGPDLDTLQGYGVVIWFSGDRYGGSSNPAAGPSSADEAALATFLDGGGHLFLSSQDYLYDMALTSFGQNYLGIDSYNNDTGDAATKYGLAGDPIGGGLGPYPLAYPGGFSDYGDVVNAGAGGSVAFRSSASGGRNLDVDRDGGAWKTVFFGTSWVPIYQYSTANGEEVLGRILDWFDGCGCEAAHEAAFDWQPQMPQIGETVAFTGTAQGDPPMTITWRFGDGGQASGETASHTYTTAGDYTVTMTATNACGADGASEVLTVQPPPCAPVQVVTVTAAISSCSASLGATLAGTPTFTYTWDLGAWGSSSGPTATLAVSATGSYPYTLTVANCGGAFTDMHSGSVEIWCEAAEWRVYLPIMRRE
jgi:PKD repeat protein